MRPLPPIAPTGAMASGEYTDYMIEYDNSAEDVIADNLTEAGTLQTMENWYKLWVRILGEVDTRITKIESSVSAMKQQIVVIDSKIRSL